MKPVSLLLLVGCAPNLLAPREMPQRVMPAVPEPAPEPNKSAVALDVDEPAMIEEVSGHYEGLTSGGHAVEGESYTTICAQTPCGTSLPRGTHRIRITSLADPGHQAYDQLAVEGQPQLDYRMNLGHSELGDGFGFLPASVGVAAMIFGAVFTGIGKFGQVDPITKMDNRTDFGPTGTAMLLGGAALTAVGAVLLYHHRGTAQASTSLTWTP